MVADGDMHLVMDYNYIGLPYKHVLVVISRMPYPYGTILYSDMHRLAEIPVGGGRFPYSPIASWCYPVFSHIPLSEHQMCKLYVHNHPLPLVHAAALEWTLYNRAYTYLSILGFTVFDSQFGYTD